jgi:hypothetical protein
MGLEIEGYGYEYEANFYGGPFDGLADSIISVDKEGPPVYPFKVISEDLTEQKTLGAKLLDHFKTKHIADETRVAVYKIEGQPDEYNDEDTVPYHFKEVVTFKEYKKRYMKGKQ